MMTIPALIERELEDPYWLDIEPMGAWAGECGTFADAVYHSAGACGIALEFAGAMNGEFDGWGPKDLPGISAVDLERLGVLRLLDHAWIRCGSRHYDAAHPQGVDHPFELRCIRQRLVEALAVLAPNVLNKLLDNEWWSQSQDLLSDMLSTRAEFETQRQVLAALDAPRPK